MRRRETLGRYRKKRDFGKTSEPYGHGARGHRQPIFVVQKHEASQLHYDFRLECEGVLKSWAVPKGPSLNPKQKRLAVRVEDHPLEYASFEGQIPEGEYGAGDVIVWDRGEWHPDEDDVIRSLSKGKLTFELRGEKLRGRWALIRMSGRTGGKGRFDSEKSWLLLKENDASASEEEVTKTKPDSVLSGRKVEESRSRQRADRRARYKTS